MNAEPVNYYHAADLKLSVYIYSDCLQIDTFYEFLISRYNILYVSYMMLHPDPSLSPPFNKDIQNTTQRI